MQEYQVNVYAGEDGTSPRTEWLQNGQLHRTDGPAIEYADGRKFWYVNGKLHRLDGPAIEYANGNRFWYINGQLHRTDDPAVEYADGGKAWWIEGTRYTEAEFNLKKTKEKTAPTCSGKVVVIDGIEYQLIKK